MPIVDLPSVKWPVVGPGEILGFAASRYPDKIGLVIEDTRLTYRELDRLSDRVAKALTARGIETGDVISLYGQNSWQWIVTYHGVLKAGAVVNPVNVMLTGPELSHVLADCNASAVFAGSDQAATVSSVLDTVDAIDLFCVLGGAGGTPADERAVGWDEFLASAADNAPMPAPRVAPKDLCCIAYTSGTTGHPKGAMQSHQAVLLNCALTATMHGRTRDEVIVTALPAAHVYGNVAINSTFLAGGTVVLMERFDPALALRLVSAEKATMFEGVPAMYSMMLAEPTFATVDLASLRKSTIGGQTFAPTLAERWQARAGGPLLELWGMTEVAGLGTTHALFAPPVPGSIGVSLPGMEVKIAPTDGRAGDLAVGTPGELWVRGPLVMLGYHARPEATAEVLGADGWLRTGDIGYVDDTGHVFIIDRLKDMIITGGYNVYPAEIERVLCAHPQVIIAAVGRRPDDVRGEVAVAYVVAESGSDLDVAAILDYCKQHLAAYKRPRDVVFVDALPTTSSGKLMRRRLAELDPKVESG